MTKYLILLLAFVVGCSNPSNPKSSIQSQSVQSQGSGDFGVVPYGEIKTVGFTFKNTSSESIALTPAISGANALDFNLAFVLGCQNVEPNKSCLVKVLFNSDKKLAGSYTASLDIGGQSLSLSASIDSVPSVKYDIYLNSQKLTVNNNLDNLVTNEIKIYSLKVKNNSPILGEASNLQSSSSFFNVVANRCVNKILKPSEACYAKLIVKGDGVSEIKNTSLSFGNETVGLSLENQAQSASSLFQVSTPTLELGDFYGDGDLIIKAIALQNNGTGAGNIENISLPPGYEVTSNNCVGVKPGNKCYVRIVYSSPESAPKGIYEDELSLGDSNLSVVSNQVSRPSDLGSITISVAENVLVNNCTPLTISMKDVDNLDFVISQVNNFSINQSLFSDSQCSIEASPQMEAFESSKIFYVKSSVSGEKIFTVSKDLKSDSKNVFFYLPFSITENNKKMVVNQNYSLSASGGKPPYSYQILNGTGSLNGDSYLAPPSPTVAQVKISDSLNHEALVDIEVVSVLDSNIQSFEKLVNQSQSIQGVGGLSPYTYSVLTGQGSIDSEGLFSASASSGMVSIKITDSLNQEKIVTGQIYSLLQVNPSSIAVALADEEQLVASGGKPPYSFTKLSGVGTLSSTGLFSSLDTGSSQLQVEDSFGQSILISANVVSNISVTAGTCSYSVPEQKDCAVSSSGGVGAKTYSTTNGVIDASTGVFYGICNNNFGQSVVTATDERGNSGTVTLNYPCVYKSCVHILADGQGSASGTYWLDNDAHRSGDPSFKAYCDMNLDGGGWTLVSSNNSSSSLIPGGTGRNNNLYQLDRDSTLGEPDPNSDYIIGSVITNMPYNQARIVGFGGTSGSPSLITSSFPLDLQTSVRAIWPVSTTGTSRLVEVVPRSSATIFGTVSSSAAYFILDAVKKDFQTSGFGANANQSTVGGAGVQTAGGDPFSGLYLGHGNSEGSYEGWYNASSALNSVGYTTWVRPIYYKYPKDCADAEVRGDLNEDGYADSGMFTIDADGFGTGVDSYRVYCDFVGNTSTLNATGGTISYSGNYKIHTFTGVGTSSFNILQGSGSVEYLIVAGGGGGGGRSSGGGGAGGLRTGAVNISSNQSVIVGGGGNGGSGVGTQGARGGNSSFASIISLGGGGGSGDELYSGTSGGSGGGGKYGSAGAAGTTGQGFNGGSGTSNSWAAGGGGGAGGAGINGVQGKCGNGGIGFLSSITGTATYYAGGGGGGSHNPEPGYGSPCSRGLGGLGGGGAGGIPGGANAGIAGTDGLGGGGGGGSTASSTGGAGGRGGSGIVILRYQYKY